MKRLDKNKLDVGYMYSRNLNQPAQNIMFLTGFRLTSYQGISNVSWRTSTNWIVIYDVAKGQLAARSWARIDAAFVFTSQITGTLGVENALRAAIGRLADVIREARTGRSIIYDSALRIRSARRRFAWILRRS